MTRIWPEIAVAAALLVYLLVRFMPEDDGHVVAGQAGPHIYPTVCKAQPFLAKTCD